MKLHVLFYQPEEDYVGQYAPQALAVIDEYTLDSTGEPLGEAQKRVAIELFEEQLLDPEVDNWAWITIDIGTVEAMIREYILRPTPVVPGSASIPVPSLPQAHNPVSVTRGRPQARRVLDDEIVE